MIVHQKLFAGKLFPEKIVRMENCFPKNWSLYNSLTKDKLNDGFDGLNNKFARQPFNGHY